MSMYSIAAVAPRHTAVVKATVPFADLAETERSARARIAEALSRLGIEPAGESFTLCRSAKDALYIEPGVIVASTFAPDGDVVPSQLPAGRAVSRLLVGPFDQLAQAWPALFSWCTDQALKREGTFWQVYGPKPTDPAKQETTLYALLA
jgi:effector-binding domain-containing protein